MKVLGFETSSSVGSIALKVGERVLERTLTKPREQTEQMLALVDSLLVEAGVALRDLDAIAFGRGPGSFTGLRVSVAVAQGLSVVSGVPLVPVSSLLCLAERVHRERGSAATLVCVDAHMGEVYWGEFTSADGAVRAVGPERLSPPAEVVAPASPGWCGVGTGFAGAVLAELGAAAASVDARALPMARDLFVSALRELAAGRTTPAPLALPVYLREHTAWRRQP